MPIVECTEGTCRSPAYTEFVSHTITRMAPSHLLGHNDNPTLPAQTIAPLLVRAPLVHLSSSRVTLNPGTQRPRIATKGVDLFYSPSSSFPLILLLIGSSIYYLINWL